MHRNLSDEHIVFQELAGGKDKDGKDIEEDFIKLIGFGSARRMNHEKSVSSIDKDKSKSFLPPEII